VQRLDRLAEHRGQNLCDHPERKAL
jgi:hypothetical protein